jgi:hypothetical protein
MLEFQIIEIIVDSMIDDDTKDIGKGDGCVAPSGSCVDKSHCKPVF